MTRNVGLLVESPGTAPGSDPLITCAFITIVRFDPDRTNIGGPGGDRKGAEQGLVARSPDRDAGQNANIRCVPHSRHSDEPNPRCRDRKTSIFLPKSFVSTALPSVAERKIPGSQKNARSFPRAPFNSYPNWVSEARLDLLEFRHHPVAEFLVKRGLRQQGGRDRIDVMGHQFIMRNRVFADRVG
ncbi:hypothetical protein GALL_447900 [mine drainage metagenome]|uniref:Uncharacterized protein n=1 Tax=mine drainage metagenome TaxID=410659 RepID=A0A1J5Q135_9ZZZZ